MDSVHFRVRHEFLEAEIQEGYALQGTPPRSFLQDVQNKADQTRLAPKSHEPASAAGRRHRDTGIGLVLQMQWNLGSGLGQDSLPTSSVSAAHVLNQSRSVPPGDNWQCLEAFGWSQLGEEVCVVSTGGPCLISWRSQEPNGKGPGGEGILLWIVCWAQMVSEIPGC